MNGEQTLGLQYEKRPSERNVSDGLLFFKEFPMIFLTAVESVLSIVLIIALGFYLRNKGWFADSFAGNISKLIMNIALSASIFVSVLTYLTRDKLMALSDGLIYGALSIVFGYLIAWLMVKVLKGEALTYKYSSK